jgi:hypothetical protein
MMLLKPHRAKTDWDLSYPSGTELHRSATDSLSGLLIQRLALQDTLPVTHSKSLHFSYPSCACAQTKKERKNNIETITETRRKVVSRHKK